MGIFYNDKKILASSWLLAYLSNNHCHKISSSISDFNGYRSDIIKISNLSIKTKFYKNEILGKAAEILFENGHINFQTKNLKQIEESNIFILENGRQAAQSSYYIKIITKKWVKRIVILLPAFTAFIIIIKQIISLFS